MGSSVGVLGSNRRSKAIVTQVKQENVRLQAKVERLSNEATQLRAEIGYLRKEEGKGQFARQSQYHLSGPCTS